MRPSRFLDFSPLHWSLALAAAAPPVSLMLAAFGAPTAALALALVLMTPYIAYSTYLLDWWSPVPPAAHFRGRLAIVVVVAIVTLGVIVARAV